LERIDRNQPVTKLGALEIDTIGITKIEKKLYEMSARTLPAMRIILKVNFAIE